MPKCAQELCGNWTGDRACPCDLFDIEPEDRPIERQGDEE